MELSQRRARRIARLRSRKSRIAEGRVLVEGVRATLTALDGGAVPDFAVLSPRLRRSAAGDRVVEALRDVECHEVDEATLAGLADTEQPQGVLLVAHEPATTLGDLPGTGRFLVLDAVQDPGNVGTLVRSAVAFGFDGVVCLDGTGDPWSAKAVRSSAGLGFRLPVVVCTVKEAIGALATRGIPIVVASPEGGRAREGADPGGGSLALVVGNEGEGVRGEVRAASERTVGIPMQIAVESINVGIAASILMYELSREDA